MGILVLNVVSVSVSELADESNEIVGVDGEYAVQIMLSMATLLSPPLLPPISFATLNIVGGFSVTGRILEMFKKND